MFNILRYLNHGKKSRNLGYSYYHANYSKLLSKEQYKSTKTYGREVFSTGVSDL